jgi:hypothetical protein
MIALPADLTRYVRRRCAALSAAMANSCAQEDFSICVAAAVRSGRVQDDHGQRLGSGGLWNSVAITRHAQPMTVLSLNQDPEQVYT